jgi:hypothetical protein
MGEFNSGQRNGRISKGLKAHHGGASAFDRTMILLNDIVEIAAAPHLHVLPLRILTDEGKIE